MTRSFYKAGVHKKGFAFDKLLFFSALKRSMNNANKISARYSVAGYIKKLARIST